CGLVDPRRNWQPWVLGSKAQLARDRGHTEILVDMYRRRFQPDRECGAPRFVERARPLRHEPLGRLLRDSETNLLVRRCHNPTSTASCDGGNASVPAPDTSSPCWGTRSGEGRSPGK